jgi:hypothetical protein
MARTQNEKDRDDSIVNLLSAILKALNKVVTTLELEKKDARK